MKQGFWVRSKDKNIIFIFSILLSFAIMMLVYLTGGTPTVYGHLMYIPIVLTASKYGTKKGLFIAVLGGIQLGPFMPPSVQDHIEQQSYNWMIRMCIFIAIALIISFFSEQDRKNKNVITSLLTHNQNTGLKNIEAIKSEEDIDGISKTIVVLSIQGIQDTKLLFGYLFENRIISEISDILNHIVKKYENAEIYQYYGMQFVLKIPGDAEKLISEIRNLDKSVLRIDNIPIYFEVHMGIAEIEGDISTYEGLRRAQIAYSYTKTNDDLKECRFEKNLEDYFKNILNVAGRFSEAISQKRIGVAYQNIVNSKDGAVHSAELLARWQKDDGSYISPDLFIPIVEKTELIQELTKYIITCAIEFLQKNEDKDIMVSINFSKRDFMNDSIDFLLNSIEKSGVNPAQIQIEVIERNLVDVDDLKVHLDKIQANHIKIALDDFGTDYSSYQYLGELNLDTIKLDKSLIYNIHESETSRRLVKSIVQFCKDSDIKTVAEGVETKEIADICKEIGVDYLQGYYFYKPEMSDRYFGKKN